MIVVLTCCMRIYCRFQELKRQAIEKISQERRDKEYRGTEIDELRDDVNQIHPRKIRKKDRKSVRSIIVELAESEQIPVDGYPESILAAAESLKNLWEALSNRPQYFATGRLHGEAPAIRKQVAEEASQRFGISIPPNYVKWITDDRKGEFEFKD